MDNEVSCDNTGTPYASHDMDKYIARLSSLGFAAPTAVQACVMPHIGAGESLLFQSETGTGKTYAYLLPLIERMMNADTVTSDDGNGSAASSNGNKASGTGAAMAQGKRPPRILIVCPTPELGAQIKAMAATVTDMKVTLLFGSSSMRRQIESLKEKPAIVVGSAARLCELIEMKKLKTTALAAAVFDEVDRLVKKDTIDGTRALLEVLPKGLQTVGCSATVTQRAREFFAGVPVIEMPREDVLSCSIEHWAILSNGRDKADTLRSLIHALQHDDDKDAAQKQGGADGSTRCKILVFAQRSYDVEHIAGFLKAKGVQCEGIFGKCDKQERKAALDRFRSGRAAVLVTSDLSARGLDIGDVTHVVQMDMGDDIDAFVHRAGRTARAGKSGVNIVIGDEIDLERLDAVAKRLGIKVQRKDDILRSPLPRRPGGATATIDILGAPVPLII